MGLPTRGLTVSLRKTEESLPQKHKSDIPKGIEPSIKWDGEKGYIDTPALADEPDPAIWSEIIKDWGLNPELTEIIDGSVHIRGWDTNVGNGTVQRMRYYRASIRRKSGDTDRADVEALCAAVMKHKPAKNLTPSGTGNRAFVVLLSDWQLGKGENGGTEATIQRILMAYDLILVRIKELVKAGRPPSYIYLIGLGDMCEQCDGHYAMQTFLADLDRRAQMRVARRLIFKLVEMLTATFDIPVILAAVLGNHGENRKNGKAYTTWTDNDDLAVFEQVGETLLCNPERYGLVSVPDFDQILNPDDLTLTLDIAGVPCSFAHGHQFRSGSNSQAKIEGWWEKQAMGRQPVAEAAILFSGHFHHFLTSEAKGRTVFQTPAMDGGSNWFTSSSGMSSPAGMLTLGVGLDYGLRGWGDVQVIGQ